jgi:hypothetical protein
MKRSRTSLVVILVLCAIASVSPTRAAEPGEAGPSLEQLPVSTVASTVPAKGDLNPYGVSIVPETQGRLQRGHILVSNFNNSSNLQGTGSTIVQVSPAGEVTLFAQINASKLPGPCPGGVGLTTALVALRAGWVIVGSLPTTDGTAATAQAGCLIVLNSDGVPVTTFAGPKINGPWDMTALDRGFDATLFFTNVLNGTVAAKGQVVNTATIVRLDLDLSGLPQARALTVIASGLPARTDPAALVIGPTGLGLSPTLNCGFFARSPACDRAPFSRVATFADGRDAQMLYVADTLNNRIGVIRYPLNRPESSVPVETLTSNGFLNGPLGLAVAPDGNILTVNGNDGFIAETTPDGRQIAHRLLDDTGSPPGAGALFGLATVGNGAIYFVDDASNTLNRLH